MAIVLYREGNTHTIRGVVCEAKRFQPEEIDWCMGEGWYTSPDDMTVIEDEAANVVDELAGCSPDEIRQKAKEAGISEWEKKRLKTLKIELKYESKD